MEENKKEHMAEMCKRSGEVVSNDPLVSFLYELIRDYIVPGKIEHMMINCSQGECHFTNGWLANYAKDIAERLRGK